MAQARNSLVCLGRKIQMTCNKARAHVLTNVLQMRQGLAVLLASALLETRLVGIDKMSLSTRSRMPLQDSWCVMEAWQAGLRQSSVSNWH